MSDLTTTTENGGKYQFGTVDNMLSAGNYTVIPSGNFAPASRNITITTQLLGDMGEVPWPVSGVDFKVLVEPEFLFNTMVDYDVGSRPVSVSTGDLDGDGDLDLAVANFYGYTVSVLINLS